MATYYNDQNCYETSVLGLWIEQEGDDCFFLEPLADIDFDAVIKADPNWTEEFNRRIILYTDKRSWECEDSCPNPEKLAYIVWNDDHSICYERDVTLTEKEKLAFKALLMTFSGR